MNTFEAVKKALPIADYARTLTELRPNGLRLVGCCPIPGHEDRTPSFNVWPSETGGSWYCFGACARGGDVIDLCQAVEGGEPWEAMMTLAMRYGVELPQRPRQWFEWQDKKASIREAATKHLAKVYQRRLTKVYTPLVLVGGESPEEELEELQELASALWPQCLALAERRVTDGA